MPLEFQLWPEEIIRLNEELANGLHQDLERYLEKELGPNTGGEKFFLERYGLICAFCGIAIDGTFDSNQLLEISKIMLVRLIEMRVRPDNGRPEIIQQLH